MFTTKKSVIALLAGLVTGVAAGLLLAPKRFIQSPRGLAYRASEGVQDQDLSDSTTVPLSEISEDFGQLEALRSQFEAGQA